MTEHGGVPGQELGAMLGRGISWLLSRLLFTAHLVLVAVALRDSQRAEYLADELAARAGGTDAAARLFDVFVRAETVQNAVRQASSDAAAGRGGATAAPLTAASVPQRWRAAVARALTADPETLRRLRQLSVREETSLFASHPPCGLRHRMVDSRPRVGAAVQLTESRRERIDAELATHYERARRDLAWSR